MTVAAFLISLKEIAPQFEWNISLGFAEMIQTTGGDCKLCPIEAVAFARLGKLFGDHTLAADALGLCREDAIAIGNAADWDENRHVKLRKRIIEAIGLKEAA